MVLDFGSFTRKQLLVEHMCPADALRGLSTEGAEGVRPERRCKKTETSDLSGMMK